MEENVLIREKAKLRLEAADLKHRLLKIKNRQMELTNQEKKKKMKESTPPPLKERKEIRKEDCYNNYNDNKGDFETQKTIMLGTVFCPSHSGRDKGDERLKKGRKAMKTIQAESEENSACKPIEFCVNSRRILRANQM